jgi:Ca-activated chloride channel family protein
VLPDRITGARKAIDDLLSAAHDARVALIAFAGETYTVAPLTDDVATMRLLLDPLSPSLMPEQGEQLAPALDEAGRLLAAGPRARGQIVVLTDGFSDAPQAMLSAARLRQQGSTVNLVGIGTAQNAAQSGASVGLAHDAGAPLGPAPLDAALLARVAHVGGGEFLTLSELPQLIAHLQAVPAGGLDAAQRIARSPLRRRRDDGIWLLPPLLLLCALLARRGWL